MNNWITLRRGQDIVKIVRPRRGDPDVWFANRRQVKFHLRAACCSFGPAWKSASAAAMWHWLYSRKRREEWKQNLRDLCRLENDGGICNGIAFGDGDTPWEQVVVPPNIPVPPDFVVCDSGCT